MLLPSGRVRQACYTLSQPICHPGGRVCLKLMCTCHGYILFFFFLISLLPVPFFSLGSLTSGFCFQTNSRDIGLYIVYVWIRIKCSYLERSTGLLGGVEEAGKAGGDGNWLLIPTSANLLCNHLYLVLGKHSEIIFSKLYYLIDQSVSTVGLYDIKWLIKYKVICMSELVTMVFIWVFPQASR